MSDDVAPLVYYLRFHEAGRDPAEEHAEQFRHSFLADALRATYDTLAHVVEADPPKRLELPPASEVTPSDD